jgi:hypothetical protein
MKMQITSRYSTAILAHHSYSSGFGTCRQEYKVNIIIYYGRSLVRSFKDENYGWTVQMTFTLHNLYNEQMQTLIPPRK